MNKYLSFDLGLAHTGVAISHEGKLASSLTTIHTTNPDKLFSQLLSIIDHHQPDEVVLGLPTSGPIHTLAQDFATKLKAKNLTVTLVNEDFSSRLAQDAQIQSNTPRGKRQSHSHQAAAAAILQSYLDNLLQ